jgi:hypothetical protein
MPVDGFGAKLAVATQVQSGCCVVWCQMAVVWFGVKWLSLGLVRNWLLQHRFNLAVVRFGAKWLLFGLVPKWLLQRRLQEFWTCVSKTPSMFENAPC